MIIFLQKRRADFKNARKNCKNIIAFFSTRVYIKHKPQIHNQSINNMNPFSVQTIDNIPRLCKNNTPIAPLFFWQTLIEAPEARHLQEIGIELFTCFRSAHAFEHPFWVGENEYDFSFFDDQINNFVKLCPHGYLMPRVYMFAPDWFLKKYPDTQISYPDHSENRSMPHESFASARWLHAQGEALRQLVRHFKNAPYGDRIFGIHIAAGSCGEWNGWNPMQPDTSSAMEARLGHPLPPPAELDREYMDAFFTAKTDAISHFCKIVKAESDYLTAIFYGYFACCYRPWNKHGALEKVLRLPELDIIAAPHEYSRRTAGEDGYFRALAATIARNGKLFVDEADDRTPLATRRELANHRIIADTDDEAINLMRRELGRALTNLAGLWYMDIDNAMFRSGIYYREIYRAKFWSERALALPWKRVSRIAVISADDGRFDLPAEHRFMAYDEGANNALLIPELCRIGAPFDMYSACDATFDVLQNYQLIILINGLNISASLRSTLKSLRNQGRTFIWGYGSGAWLNNKYDPSAMLDLTGIYFESAATQPMPKIDDFSFDWYESEISPGFFPLSASAEYPDWSSFYRGYPRWDVSDLHAICRKCGVFLYCDSFDIVDASESALLFHATSSGEKHLFLPSPHTVTDMISGNVIGKNLTRFSFSASKGETRLFELS